MMATEHEPWLERGELYALGALDGEELNDFQSHLGANCAICKSSLQETRETLNLLPRSLRPMAPRPELKARLLAQIDRESVVSIPERKESQRWQRMVGTIAAGIMAVVLVGAYYQYRQEARDATNRAVVNLLRHPATRDLPLYGVGPTPAAKGRFLWNDSGEGHVFVTNLPTAPAGKIYAVWTIARDSAPLYVGVIKTGANGQGSAHIKSAPSALPIETFAVSLENAGIIAAPAGPIVLVSKQS